MVAEQINHLYLCLYVSTAGAAKKPFRGFKKRSSFDFGPLFLQKAKIKIRAFFAVSFGKQPPCFFKAKQASSEKRWFFTGPKSFILAPGYATSSLMKTQIRIRRGERLRFPFGS